MPGVRGILELPRAARVEPTLPAASAKKTHRTSPEKTGLVVMHAFMRDTSAGEGGKITLPFDTPSVGKPIGLRLNRPAWK
jgi:hypothetical protein